MGRVRARSERVWAGAVCRKLIVHGLSYATTEGEAAQTAAAWSVMVLATCMSSLAWSRGCACRAVRVLVALAAANRRPPLSPRPRRAPGAEAFRSYMSKFGTVEDAYIMYERETHRSRGFGFVVFRTAQEARAVLNGSHELDGRKVRAWARGSVKWVTRPPRHPPPP